VIAIYTSPNAWKLYSKIYLITIFSTPFDIVLVTHEWLHSSIHWKLLSNMDITIIVSAGNGKWNRWNRMELEFQICYGISFISRRSLNKEVLYKIWRTKYQGISVHMWCNLGYTFIYFQSVKSKGKFSLCQKGTFWFGNRIKPHNNGDYCYFKIKRTFVLLFC
jgi:hypothetical protein